MDLDHVSLKARQRAERNGHPADLALRVHRALSWYGRAERCGEDADARFIFLWIVFNAAYANELGDANRFSEQQVFQNFIDRLCELDGNRRLYDLVWSEFTGSVRVLLDNKYVFQPFWDFHNGKISEEAWQSSFKRAKTAAANALRTNDTATVIRIILSRMYTLRNQLVHGGATWNSSINRDQLRDCCRFLGKLVPLIIVIMMDHPNALWGEACYPVVAE